MLARNSCYFKSQEQYKRIDFRWCRTKPTYRQIKLGQPLNWLTPYHPSRKIVFAAGRRHNQFAHLRTHYFVNEITIKRARNWKRADQGQIWLMWCSAWPRQSLGAGRH